MVGTIPEERLTEKARAIRETPETPYRNGLPATGALDTSTPNTETLDTGIDAERLAEIEAVSMRLSMEYESKQGWVPEDVSSENHGFDIRSTKYDQDGSFTDIRYTEVKARAQSGAIHLSANEWKKARHFEEKFCLYIVTDAGTDEPNLHRIRDPGEQFREDEDIFAT